MQLLQAITRAKKLDIQFLQRVSRDLLNRRARSADLEEVPLSSNGEKTVESLDSRQPMSVLGIRICSELGAEDDDFHYFCDHRATVAWQNRLNE